MPVRFGEPFGIYAVEAMAAGTPIVQPARGAFPELTQLTGGGITYDPDTPSALADALQALLIDPARTAEMGQAGRAGVRQHLSMDRMVNRFLEAATATSSSQRSLP